MSNLSASRYYRRLLKQTAVTEMMVELPNPGGLLQAVRGRYRQVVSRNLQLPPRQRKFVAKKQQQESFPRIMTALEYCHQNETLISLARALSMGYGNESYKATLFRHFAETLFFDSERQKRQEVDEVTVSERQNKLMAAAVFPYVEKLCILCSPTLQNSSSSTNNNSDNNNNNENQTVASGGFAAGRRRNDDMLRALASRKAGVTVEYFPSDPHCLVVEVDENLNKQTIYLSAPANSSREFLSETFDGEEEKRVVGEEEEEQEETLTEEEAEALRMRKIRVDTAQLESQRGTILHLEWMNAARRCLDTLTDESSVHRSRGTVLVGHGIAGAVATALALMMQAEGFTLRNVVTFGAPKVIEEVQERHAATLNSIRVVSSGDPIVHLPVSGIEGGLFRHVGEVLQVTSPAAERTFGTSSYYFSSSSADKKKSNKKKANKKKKNEPSKGDEAEILAAMLNNEEEPATTTTTSTTTSSSRRQEEDDDEDDDEEVERKEEIKTAEDILNQPFSVLAYKLALADEDSKLEYFERDDAIWEEDDVRELHSAAS